MVVYWNKQIGNLSVMVLCCPVATLLGLSNGDALASVVEAGRQINIYGWGVGIRTRLLVGERLES